MGTIFGRTKLISGCGGQRSVTCVFSMQPQCYIVCTQWFHPLLASARILIVYVLLLLYYTRQKRHCKITACVQTRIVACEVAVFLEKHDISPCRYDKISHLIHLSAATYITRKLIRWDCSAVHKPIQCTCNGYVHPWHVIVTLIWVPQVWPTTEYVYHKVYCV